MFEELPIPTVFCERFGVTDGWLVCEHLQHGATDLAYALTPTPMHYGELLCTACAAAPPDCDSEHVALMCSGCVDELSKERAAALFRDLTRPGRRTKAAKARLN